MNICDIIMGKGKKRDRENKKKTSVICTVQ